MECRRDQEGTADWPDAGISGYSWSSEKEGVSALFLWGSSHHWPVSHSSAWFWRNASGFQWIWGNWFCDWLLSSQLWKLLSLSALSHFLKQLLSTAQQSWGSEYFSVVTQHKDRVSRGSQCWRVTVQRVKKSQCHGKHVSFRIRRWWSRPLLCYLPVIVLWCTTGLLELQVLKCIWS